MTNRKLGILAVVAAVLAVLTTVLYSAGGGPRGGFVSGSPLIQGLAPEKVESIVIKHGAQSVTLQKQGDGFVLPQKSGYPASVKRINDLIERCLDVRCAEKITSSASNHAALGVADDSPDATSVSFLGADQKPLIGFIAGKSGERGRGPYVRLSNNNTVYAAQDYLYLDTDPLSYTDRKLVSLTKDDIQSVTVQTAKGAYTIARGADDKPAIQDVPEGKRPKGTAYQSIFETLANLDMSDVAKADALKLDWTGTYTCKLRNGITYTVRTAQKDGKDYVELSAQGPGANSVQITRTESDAELKKKDAMLQAADLVEKFNPAHAGWAYEVSSWDGGNLTKPLDDLIEDIPAPTAQTPDEITASHILIAYKGAERSTATRTKEEAKALADEVLTKAKAPDADFAALAKQVLRRPEREQRRRPGRVQERRDGPGFREGGLRAQGRRGQRRGGDALRVPHHQTDEVRNGSYHRGHRGHRGRLRLLHHNGTTSTT